jgi:hypothetical protein
MYAGAIYYNGSIYIQGGGVYDSVCLKYEIQNNS